MKRMLLLFLLLLQGTLSSYAQNTFAPVGAEWWHSSVMHVGYDQAQINCSFHTRSISDTTIDGIVCRKVTTEVDYVANIGGEYHRPDAQNYFFYDNTDTVFVYNKNFNRFTPIYVFNAQEGDTICLPVPPGDDPDMRINPLSGDTSFCFVIDSIRLETFENEQLRTYYTNAITQMGQGSGNMAFPSYSWGNIYYPKTDVGGDGPVTRGKYTERIIGVFFPRKILSCVDCPHFPYAPYGQLGCYSDSLYDLKLVSEACDTLYPLGINTLQSARNILKLYPNPAKDQFTIMPDKPLNDDLLITVTDVSGRMLEQTTLFRKEQHKTIMTKGWAAGLYLVRFNTGDQLYYDKIVVSGK